MLLTSATTPGQLERMEFFHKTANRVGPAGMQHAAQMDCKCYCSAWSQVSGPLTSVMINFPF